MTEVLQAKTLAAKTVFLTTQYKMALVRLFQDFQPTCSWSATSQTDRQTDGRHAIAIPRFAL